ncbi:hypothetical protein [Euzebya rosea]|uniref:hypothetical protein n=1 Tax=Euzebya rosea TaxID=2052804 RepID=UPI000D3E49A1|nr:hypothetical protein [Euzebya rosea]
MTTPMTNPGPRPVVLQGTGRVVGAGERTDVAEEDLDTPGLRPVRPPTGPRPPAGNARTDQWAAHAASIGVELPDDATRDQIKAAVAAHTEES